MTITTLAQTIRRLPAEKRIKLFNRLETDLEDYLLSKIAHDRFRKTSSKRISWETLKS